MWRQIHDLLSYRSSSVALSKVKGHATVQDVRRGRVSARDKHGNDGADRLAVSGAAANSLPSEVVREALHRKRVVRDVQSMMVDILAARARQLSVTAAADIASSSHNDETSGSSSTESCSYSEPESESSSSRSSFSAQSSMQSSVALHSGSDHPT